MPRPLDTSVQTLRGVAALLVVAFHARSITTSDGLGLSGSDPWSWSVDTLTVLRMPLFAFLAGFVYASRPLRSDYLVFVRGKARRLLLPMLVVGTTCAVLVPDSGPVATPWYLWHVEPIRQLWFVEAIFWIFLAVGLLDLRGWLDRLGVVVALVVATLVLDAVLPLGDDLLGGRYAVYLVPFFLSGLAASRFDWRAAGSALTLTGCIVAALLLGSTLLGLIGTIRPISEPHDPVVGAAGIGACLLLIRSRWTSPWLARIGGFSFSIYLMHIAGIVVVLDLTTAAGVTSPTVATLLALVGGATLPILVEILARRSRWTRLLILGKRLGSARRSGRHAAMHSGPESALTRP